MRRPARLERAGALTPRDRVWAAIRDFGPGNLFSVAEIMLLAEQRADTVLPYLKGLAAAGYVTKDQARPTRRPRREFQWYRLARDIGVEAPRVDTRGKPVTQGQGNQQLWSAMKTLKNEFTAREIALAASTEDCVIAERSAIRYCRFLTLAGYLQSRAVPRGGYGPKRYFRFLRARNTGPRAPMLTADGGVQDANTGDIVYSPATGARP